MLDWLIGIGVLGLLALFAFLRTRHLVQGAEEMGKDKTDDRKSGR